MLPAEHTIQLFSMNRSSKLASSYRTKRRLNAWMHSRFHRVTYRVRHSPIFFLSSLSILSCSRLVSVSLVTQYFNSSGYKSKSRQTHDRNNDRLLRSTHCQITTYICIYLAEGYAHATIDSMPRGLYTEYPFEWESSRISGCSN
jgi:hypothetical protein